MIIKMIKIVKHFSMASDGLTFLFFIKHHWLLINIMLFGEESKDGEGSWRTKILGPHNDPAWSPEIFRMGS